MSAALKSLPGGKVVSADEVAVALNRALDEGQAFGFRQGLDEGRQQSAEAFSTALDAQREAHRAHADDLHKRHAVEIQRVGSAHGWRGLAFGAVLGAVAGAMVMQAIVTATLSTGFEAASQLQGQAAIVGATIGAAPPPEDGGVDRPGREPASAR